MYSQRVFFLNIQHVDSEDHVLCDNSATVWPQSAHATIVINFSKGFLCPHY